MTVSVIMPVYNTIKYLPAAVKSVMNQTYRDLEIILVDDGSTDGSGELCDEYAENDSRIKVIHKENGGQSAARNMALDRAKGDFICFADSDDVCDERIIEVLYNMLIKFNADISVCQCVSFNEGHLEEVKAKKIPEKVDDYENIVFWNNQDKYKMLTNIETRFSAPWAKLFKKEIFDNCRFLEGHLHEDQRILADITLKVKNTVVCDEKLYYYMERPGSSTQKPLDKSRMFDHIESIEHACVLLKEAGEYKVQKEMARHTCNSVMFYYEEIERLKLDNIKELKKDLRKKYREIMKLNENVFSYKQVMYQLFGICPYLALKVKRIRK